MQNSTDPLFIRQSSKLIVLDSLISILLWILTFLFFSIFLDPIIFPFNFTIQTHEHRTCYKTQASLDELASWASKLSDFSCWMKWTAGWERVSFNKTQNLTHNALQKFQNSCISITYISKLMHINYLYFKNQENPLLNETNFIN